MTDPQLYKLKDIQKHNLMAKNCEIMSKKEMSEISVGEC
jgi:hypothetical protein